MIERRFIGGLRVLDDPHASGSLLRSWKSNATYPFAELIIDDERVRLRLRYTWMERFKYPSAQVSFEASIVGLRAQPYGASFINRGVLLQPSVGLDSPSAFFWCGRGRQREVLDALQQRGALVRP